MRRQSAAPLRPQHAEAVGIVDHQPVAALGGQTGKLRPGALIPIHAEHPLRDDQAPVWFELALESSHIVVTEALHLAGELAAHLLQGGVVEPVLPQQMLLAEQGLQHSLIGRKTAVEQQHRLHPQPVSERLFQLLVSTAVAGHQGRGTGASPIAVNPVLESGLDGRMIGQSQIVVSTEVEVVAARYLQPPPHAAIGGSAAAKQRCQLSLGQSRAQCKGAFYRQAIHDRATPARGRVAS